MIPTTAMSKTLARIGASVLLLAGSGLSACATAGGSLTSPYLNTADGYFYKYGNFCGPGWPNYPSDDPQENIAFIDTLEPVDDIDRVCRAHDRCYFEFGADNPQCDLMLAELLRDHSQAQLVIATGNSFLPNEFNGQCANLAREILTAVGQIKQGDLISDLAGRAGEDAQNTAIAQLVFSGLRGAAAGWPEVPGLCFFSDDQRASSGSGATQALLAAASSGGLSAPSSFASFEPFFPASEASLAPGRSALIRRREALAAAEAAAAEAASTEE
jgi:hypothetical protein